MNWWATDAFLGGNFNTYGPEVFDYYNNLNEYERQNSVDPMCNAFPTKVHSGTLEYAHLRFYDIKLGSFDIAYHEVNKQICS